MSTGFYVKGKDNLATGDINLIADTFVVVLIDTDIYTVDFDNDEFQLDIPEAAIIAERTLIANSLSSNVFDGDDLLFPLFTAVQTVGAFAIIKDTDATNTSLLLCYIDNAPELPITPDGSDFTIQWNNGPDKIFKL